MIVHPSSHDFEPFKYKTLEDLKRELKRLSIPLPISSNTLNLNETIQSKHFIIPNRLSIQPMEGFDAKLDGSPSDLTFRRYKRYAKGGVGLIWFEATGLLLVVLIGFITGHKLIQNNKDGFILPLSVIIS